MILSKVEYKILKSLIEEETYVRKVLPFVKNEYFDEPAVRVIHEELKDYIDKYNYRPSYDALAIAVSSRANINDSIEKSALALLSDFQQSTPNTNEKWMLDMTEKFCQKSALHNAIKESIEIIGDKKKSEKSEGMIPKLLQDALSVSFDRHVGHDYFDDSESRFDFYHKTEKRFPFDIDILNTITAGGVPSKTLNILMGGTGGFKTGTMCHLATAYLQAGYNVLYITLEMSEEKIAERIDANLLNTELDALRVLTKENYDKKVAKARANTVGKLIIKEYPTASASVTHFRSLLNELLLKKNFKPQIIMIDYLNICASSRIKLSGAVNSYTYVKSIAEEIRGLAIEFDVPIWSATQTNRAGFSSSDPDLTNTSESFGLPATADLFLIIMMNEQLAELNQMMFIQGKNRLNDTNKYKRFVVGVDKSKMRLYNLEASAQDDIADANQPKQQNKTAKKPFGKPDKAQSKFSGLQV